MEKAPDTAYQDVLNEYDSTWGVKGLIVTWSNLVVSIHLLSSPWFALVRWRWLYVVPF